MSKMDFIMTGISGFFKKNGVGQEVAILAAMLDTLSEGLKKDEFVVQREIGPEMGAIVSVRWSWMAGNKVFADSADMGCSLCIQGDMYGSTLGELQQSYRSKGKFFLHDSLVDGAFSGVLLDKAGKKVIIFTDYFGLEPLYYYFHDGVFAFSSNIKGLLAVPGFKKNVDLLTLASFWNFGYALLDHTPFKHVRLLPPGTVFVLDLHNWQEESLSYDVLADIFARSGTGETRKALDETARAFRVAVQKRSDDASSVRLGLSLSGGLDSRAILGGVAERGSALKTYTLGLPGCADERLAARMAEVCKSTHRFIPINEADLEDFESLARMMVTLSDGLYHPHESTERVALNYLESRPFDVMLRGHGGEIAKAALAYPFQAGRAMVDMAPGDVVRSLFVKSSLAGSNINMASLLTNDMHEATDGAAWRMFQQAAEPAVAAGLSNIDLCVYLYIDQCIRRQVVASLSLFRSKVGVRLPYLDRNFLTSLLQLPVEKRWAGEFHHYFIHHFAPQLESIPDSNTGAPLNAGPLRLFITDKANAVLKRLGVTGFRHYTEFQKWQRKYFSEVTKQILFSEQSLARNYYKREGLREIYDLHVSGQKSYAHFLGTAVAIELWHRIFVD